MKVSRLSNKSGFVTEQWPIGRPIPYARNARKITQAAIDKVAASIKEFGFQQPIVVDEEDVILAGHTRLLGAQKLGLEDVPVHVAKGLTKAQAKAFRLADNRLHQETTWDDVLLSLEIGELNTDFANDIDLMMTGFEPEELATLLTGIPGELEDPTDDGSGGGEDGDGDEGEGGGVLRTARF